MAAQPHPEIVHTGTVQELAEKLVTPPELQAAYFRDEAQRWLDEGGAAGKRRDKPGGPQTSFDFHFNTSRDHPYGSVTYPAKSKEMKFLAEVRDELRGQAQTAA